MLMMPRAPAFSPLSSLLSFPNATLSLVALAEPVHDGRDHPARTAPGRPHVDDGDAAVGGELVETRSVEFLNAHGLSPRYLKDLGY